MFVVSRTMIQESNWSVLMNNLYQKQTTITLCATVKAIGITVQLTTLLVPPMVLTDAWWVILVIFYCS